MTVAPKAVGSILSPTKKPGHPQIQKSIYGMFRFLLALRKMSKTVGGKQLSRPQLN